MKYYELTYLISPDLSSEEFKKNFERIKNFIGEENGTLEKITIPSKIELSYPLKKKLEAFSVTLNFHLEPEKLENLEKKLKSKNQILRYLILTKKVPKQTFIKEDLVKREKFLKIPRKTAEPKKVELEEIDKKLEEILNE